MEDLLFVIYPWVKSLHIMAVISWMAGLFYLPRLFVYHVEKAEKVQDAPAIFQEMEEKLIRVIMRPAMVVSWVCGLLMVMTPGIVDWAEIWPWAKGASVIGMTWFHHWLAMRRKDFLEGRNRLTGRQYRMMNEVPTLLMVVIVLAVILKF
ncbi:CopD family protein [Ruegeria sp. WL0004]|uniref:Protoporphyrinogen IX oxidase n=1 Tax=Ruegeria marisflavi TaxID=2984152 RepID=A0ABT2WNI1_9RHOB|nr:CopD family protein [Ruegeria sp. WL0004]MCU9837217.1 CopD family protein [Ruegeria sp. WL0004]